MNKIGILFLFLCCMACSPSVEYATTDDYQALVLPDGSEVYLNHHSRLSYEGDFEPRTVHLEGEGFFKVVHGTTPFSVITPRGEITVLGTEFSVKSTSEAVAVDVKKGSVALRTAYDESQIKKGMKAVYKEGEQTVQRLKSNREYRKWMRNLKKELKKVGKELKPALKEVGGELKKAGKKLGKELQ